ncbi:hypothetical protein DY000_02043024 [Brassica cretica]|uniref:Phosphoenolpyruvate carboxylase n=1 Tax=Brassica cretica TaxID=69181 RepID=A0ABQ7BPE4_BRACR|nr:hypothetical protein DY000_02043024 [Brassica cretica]
MAGRNIEKKASIDAQLRQLVPAKMSEDDKLIEYDALLLDRFLDILHDLHELYELSAKYEGKHEPKKLEELGKVLTSLDPGDSIVISKAFSHMLNLANLAEEVQIAYRRRIKKLKKGDFVDESSAATESDIEETFKRLVSDLGKSPEEIFDALKNQTVDLVLTAHPTQSVRRSLLQKHGRIRDCLAQLYTKDITPDDKQELDESLQREVSNPRVTPEVTRDVCLLARMMAANLYYNQIENLMFELSMWRCTDEFRVAADVIHRNSRKDAAKHYIEFWKTIPPTEPYRVVLGDVRDTLYHTRERTRQLLSNGISDIPEEATFTDVEQFLEPLELCYRSLCSSGDRPIADGTLLDFLRQVSTFGLSLVRLDIRQEDWSEERRQEWLLAELRGKRPLFGLDLPKTEEIADVLDTFKVISELPSDCFGAYIISMATSPSDVLVVELLQRECHVKKPLRVVPLFEKLADLEAAPAAVSRQLLLLSMG